MVSKFSKSIILGGLLGALTVIVGYAAYKDYKSYKEQPLLTTASMFGNKSRYVPLNGLGTGKSYTFPRNSLPKDPSFVKEL